MNREGAEVTSAGRAFQTRAPATEKAQRPTGAKRHLKITTTTRQVANVVFWPTGGRCSIYRHRCSTCFFSWYGLLIMVVDIGCVGGDFSQTRDTVIVEFVVQHCIVIERA